MAAVNILWEGFRSDGDPAPYPAFSVGGGGVVVGPFSAVSCRKLCRNTAELCCCAGVLPCLLHCTLTGFVCSLNTAGVQFYLLFCMGAKLGLSH
jgi:hypothetical protein